MPDSREHTRKHIRFLRTSIDQPRRRPARPISKPEKDNERFGDELRGTTEILQRTFNLDIQSQPPEFNPAFIFRLKLDGYVSPEDWRRSGLTLLSDEPNDAVVLFAEDQLVGFRERIAEYGSKIGEDKTSPAYAWIASLTTEMELWGREHRIGTKLEGIQVSPTESYRLDVELWHYGTQDERNERMQELQGYVDRVGGAFLDQYNGPTLCLARILISGEALDELLNAESIQTIDLPPAPSFTIGPLLNTSLDDFPSPVGSPPDDAPGICVIDSGINRGHPMLGPAIGDTISVPKSLGDALDEHGHGTKVAGIALYGDVRRCIDDLDFRPSLYLFGAKVTNAQNQFDDDRLIVTQMREAVEVFNSTYGCRVFNISLGDPALVYHGGKPSPWAQVLDDLARELDVVIVVSAGNLPILGLSGPEAESIRAKYPRYLLEPTARIIEPATSANVLTVGSIVHSEDSFYVERYPNDPAIRCIAKVDQPSPFTRCGPGVNDAIKPEVCEYGGNIVWDGRGVAGGRILNNDPGVGIVSTNVRHIERLFTSDVGTSMAAPKVAHLAAQVLAQYPEASANLVRALIANSASVPAQVCDQCSEADLLRMYGYGRPSAEAAIFSTDHRVTLVSEDEIQLRYMHLYEIPIPEDFKLICGERRVIISLAFDPPVRHTRKDYLGIKMSYRLFRGLTTDQIVSWYGERDREASPEELPAKYQCQMVPSPTCRERGTLQKATFRVVQNRALTDYPGDAFHLLLSCLPVWATPEDVEKQRYALAVTLETPPSLISLYDVIRQTVRLPQRVQVRSS